MKFLIDYSKKPCEYMPVYNKDENSFSILESNPVDDIALMIGNSYTYLGATSLSNTVCYIYGINPRKDWKKATLIFPDANPGKLYFETDKELIPGVEYETAKLDTAYFDKRANIVCIGETDIESKELVLFNSNTVAAIKDGKLCAIFVKLV